MQPRSTAGHPARVRTDHGGKNIQVWQLMEDRRGPNRGSFLAGSSTRNQRIEYLWLKQYHLIDFNNKKRTRAKHSFEEHFFKLMNNSVFGKRIENIRKRVDVRLVTEEKQALKLAVKPTYVSSKICNENLVAIHKIKLTLTLYRPAYVGMCILDLSKTLMYDFHSNYIKQKYDKKAKLLFTDTDSF